MPKNNLSQVLETWNQVKCSSKSIHKTGNNTIFRKYKGKC